jgi:ABC-type spermidine/putrescine transport system permease subunit I
MKMKFLQTESITEYSLMTSLFLLLPVIFLYLIFFIYPLGRLFPISLFQPEFTLDNYIHFIDKPLYVRVLLRTLRVKCNCVNRLPIDRLPGSLFACIH